MAYRDVILNNGGQPEIWFEFDPSNPNGVFDGSGYGDRGDQPLNLYTGSNPVVTTDGPSGSGAAKFNGLTKMRSGGSTNSYSFAHFATSAIGAWVKGGTGTVWSFNTSSGSSTAGYIRLDADANGAYVIRGGASTVFCASAAGINNDGNWHHVVWQRTGDTTGTLYVDGVAVNVGNNSALTENVSGWLYLGDNGYSVQGSNFDGQMAHPYHYPGGLTAQNIQAHYLGGITATVAVDVDTPTLTLNSQDVAVDLPVTPVNVATATMGLANYSVTVQADRNIVVDVPTTSISTAAVEPLEVVSRADVAVDVATAQTTVKAVDATIQSAQVVSPSRDWTFSDQGNLQTGDRYYVNGRGGGYAYNAAVVDFELPAGFSKDNVVSVNLRLNAQYLGGGTTRIRKLVSEYPNNLNDRGGFTRSDEYIDFNPSAGWNTIDIASLVKGTGDFFGLYLEPADEWNNAGNNYYSADSAFAPSLTIVSSLIGNVVVDVDSAWISVGAHNLNLDADVTLDTPTVTLLTSDATFAGSLVVDVETASVEFFANDVTVESTESPDVIIDLDNITPIVARAHEAEFVYSEVVDVETATASIEAVDYDSVVTKAKAIIDVDAPRMRLVAPVPTDVNGEPILPSEGEDNYFDSTWSTFGGYTFGLTGNTQSPVPPETAMWYRMNERSGDTISDRAWVYRNNAGEIVPTPGITSGLPAPLNLHGVVLGQNNGPDGRHSFGFTGYSYIDGGGGGIAGANNNIEFTFRTTRSTQFIMGGAALGAGTINNPPTPPWELWMVDGVLEVRQYDWNAPGTYEAKVYTVTKMRTRLDDGNWHHVVIQRAAGSVDERSSAPERYYQFESYVDGRLEVRRRVGRGVSSFPQFIGGRVNQYYRSGGWAVVADSISPEQWFKGDMTELVYRYDDNLSEDEVTRQRDNVMNIDVYRAETPSVKFTSQDAEVRGNKPRVLVLDFGSYVGRTLYPGTDPRSRIVEFPVGEDAKILAGKMEYLGRDSNIMQHAVGADFPGYGETHTPFYSSSQTGMTQWFRFDVRQKMDANGNTTNVDYRDEITDNQRLIDLEKDLNMDDYDMISIIGFPQNPLMFSRFEAMDFQNLAPFTPAKVQIENLLKQVKNQVINKRKSLYVTDPFSAIGLGIIDDVDAVPRFKEGYVADTRIGANTGGMDWHSLITDPFGTAPAGGHVIPRPMWGFDPRDPLRELANRRLAAQYEDTHYNVRQVVRNIVPGLTTNFGYVKVDDIVWWNVNPMASPPFQRSIRYEDKRAGLEIGDQFYMAGDIIEDTGIAGDGTLRRGGGFVAAPMSAIKVGKAVTTFAPYVQARGNHMEFDQDIEDILSGRIFDMPIGSPFGDHAISIVVEQGDVWDNQYVSGKVYVNFTEFNVWNPEFLDNSQIMMFATDFPDAEPREVISLGETIQTGYDRSFVVTTEMLRYQWSTHYGSYQGSQIPLPEGGKTSDWGWSAGGVRSGGGFSTYGAGEAMSWGWSPATKLVSIPTPTMYQKGLRWLLDDLDVAGVVNASVDTAKVTVGANDVTVETVQNCIVDVPTTRISLESYSDADTISPNVVVQVGTPEIAVNVHGLVEYIDLDTPTFTLSVPVLGAGEVEVDWNEVLVFTLPRQYITLTMEEG